MVMISMTSSNSITSMSGVVLMSIMSSPSPLGFPEIIAISLHSARHVAAFSWGGRRPALGLGDEGDFADAGALAGHHDPSDELVAYVPVGADVHFGLGLVHGSLLELLQQHAGVGELAVVPEDVAVLVDGENYVLRLGLGRLVHLVRQGNRHGMRDHGNGDEKN